MKRLMLGCAAALAMALAGCGGGSDTARSRPEVVKFKEYQFFWTEGSKIDLPELPEGSLCEIHPTYIIVDAKDGWRIVIPMDRIRLINVKKQL